jgi:hypothetical protein
VKQGSIVHAPNICQFQIILIVFEICHHCCALESAMQTVNHVPVKQVIADLIEIGGIELSKHMWPEAPVDTGMTKIHIILDEAEFAGNIVPDTPVSKKSNKKKDKSKKNKKSQAPSNTGQQKLEISAKEEQKTPPPEFCSV